MKSTLYTLCFSLISIILLSSCDKEPHAFSSTERKLEGQWKYEKVKFRERFSLKNSDISFEFENDVLTFNDDHSMILSNQLSGAEFSGTWLVRTEWIYTSEEPTQTEIIEGTLIDFSNQDVDQFHWENLYVTPNKIKATEYADDGIYRYTLVKH